MPQVFRTPVATPAAPFQISHEDRLLLIGSCFTEHIGKRLMDGKFHTLINPNGIVYNPDSIAYCLERLLDNQAYHASELVEIDGLWHSWDHHGHFSKPDKQETIDGINARFEESRQFLATCTRVFISLGTADIFSLKDNPQHTVANNHKAPGNLFQSGRLKAEQISSTFDHLLTRLQQLNPEIQVVLTVSPVRHIRGGMIANQRSKAALILACADLCEKLPFVHYFPAYELLIDDLRDYRFYTADMIHPSDTAVEYIWDQFAALYFSEKTSALLERIGQIKRAAAHRPFNPDTAAFQTFATTQLGQINALLEEFPDLDFTSEKSHFQQLISK